MSVKVRDVMRNVAIAVLEDASFAEIVRTMRRYAVGAVSVVDADCRPVGVVSEDDLLLKEVDPVRHGVSIFESRKRREEHEKAAAVTASTLMSTPAITVTPGAPVRDAARLMHEKRIKQLPVIDAVTGRIVGTLRQSDVLRVFTWSAGQLERDVQAVIGDLKPVSVSVSGGVVTVSGRVARGSQAVQLVEEIRRVEGVIDVVSELTYDKDDLLIVPPLL
ncbi:CBS domain-containing protein [Nonomuraea sp. NEAU-A123]|uniref:CBS domain-containing protein n=1 Tax=Nonomuraea sp. NEAU-A123 TaxID=2839649 RepID=UPI001BE44723|nr:CBS domain-containing protein [Nonomuraea sp. NEAU-A123]MBT2233705.1 CBS domain-containing protein [Nonomuraea sp. NEAU-A123]